MNSTRRGFFGFLAAVTLAPRAALARAPVVRSTAWAGRVDAERLRSLKKTREYVLCFGQHLVAPGARATVSACTSVAMVPQRLVIPSHVARHFVLTDIRVAKNSQFRAGVELPADVFAETAFTGRLEDMPLAVSRTVELDVLNVSGSTVSFMGCVIGPALEEVPAPAGTRRWLDRDESSLP